MLAGGGSKIRGLEERLVDELTAAQQKDVAVLEERVRNLEGQLAETSAEKQEAASLRAAVEKELQAFKVTSAKAEAAHEAATEVLEKQIESLQTEVETLRTAASGSERCSPRLWPRPRAPRPSFAS